MGLSANSLRTMDSLQQIEALQAGFAKLDQTSKVATARDLFGKSGGRALALLNDPGALSQAREQSGPPESGMERFRIEVGWRDRVKPGNIVGAIANEAGLNGRSIGRIQIFDAHSLVDLPQGMPEDVFQGLRRLKVMNRELQISRSRD